uniref:Putative ovule protein n=1 Tax=Solanum chacoense TaxID=4108 RepID=A0A0V0GSJ9_SOLCH
MAKNGCSCWEVTHLQYVDDSLICCDTKEEQLRFLRVILVLFEGILDHVCTSIRGRAILSLSMK